MAPAISSGESLEGHPYLDGVPAPLLARALSQARWIHFNPGEMVLDFEDTTTEVFFVVQGRVRVVMRTADGERTQILGELNAGDVMGEMAALDGAPRSARAEALVRTTLCAVPGTFFRELVLGSPNLTLRLIRLLIDRVRVQNRRLLEHTALPTRCRIAAELLRLSRARPDGTRIVSPPPTHDVLASRIGARRETVSRELSAFRREGQLRRTRAAFVLLQPDSLRALAKTGLDSAK